MTNKTRTYLTMALMASTFLTSCSKEDDGPIDPEDRAEAIFGQWVITKHESDFAIDENRDGEYNTDLLTYETDDCAKDDIFNFLDGEFKEYNRYDDTEDGGETCHPDGVSHYNFRYYWQLNEDNTSILLDTNMDGNYTYPWEIVSLTENELELIDRYDFEVEGGATEEITVTVVFTRIE